MDLRQEQVNEAAGKLSDTVKESYRVVGDRTVSVQEFNAGLTQNLFNGVIYNLRTQAEGNREMARQLADQQQRAQEATRVLTRETVGAYMGLVNSAFSFYRGSLEEAERSAEACPADSSTPGSQAEDGLPLEDYDSLNVNQITGKMKELSVEEIRRLRDYEVRNKNRRTLMSRFNQRIEATL